MRLCSRDNKNYLISGTAGFIGFFMSKKLLENGCRVIGIDNLNDYYDVKLKQTRLEILKSFDSFTFIQGDISDKGLVLSIFNKYKPKVVINLAAQAGVRYSSLNPDIYIQSNIVGFFNILEACRQYPVEHLLYASSSSVYGSNTKVPFEETDNVNNPISLYAATKKSNELMAHTYSHLYQIPISALRFFTVYGPLGRPDMAYFTFAKQYFKGEPIKIYNNGDMDHDLYRDFTYIDDVIECIELIINHIPTGSVKHKVYNIGNNHPEKLMKFIQVLEKSLSIGVGREIVFDKVFEQMKPGDVSMTYASTEFLQQEIGFKPKTSIEEGIKIFANWFIEYFKEELDIR